MNYWLAEMTNLSECHQPLFEMLKLRDQNGNYYLDILPELPTKFAKGKITGLVNKGGFEVNIEWKNNALYKMQIISKIGNNLNVRY